MSISIWFRLVCNFFIIKHVNPRLFPNHDTVLSRKWMTWFSRWWWWRWDCVCSTLILMWHAAGSESSVAPHVLKTILLILKGKPGEIQDSFMERRRFSLDPTNMMPVVVSNTMSVSLSWHFSDHENPYLPKYSVILLDTVLLSLIHSSNTYLVSTNYMSHPDQETCIPVKDTDNKQKKYVMCQMI